MVVGQGSGGMIFKDEASSKNLSKTKKEFSNVVVVPPSGVSTKEGVSNRKVFQNKKHPHLSQ